MSLSLFLNSVAVALGATSLGLAAGLIVGLATVVAPGWWRVVLLGLTAVNLALPPFLVANLWLDVSAQWRALAPAEVVARFSLPLTALALASLLWPLTTLLVLGAWSKLQPEQLEADPCLRGRRLVRGLLLPAARGELGVAAAVTLVLALANFTVPTLFQVRVFTEEFWIRFNTQFDTWGALRAAWPLVVIPVVLLIGLRRLEVPWPRLQLSVPADRFRQQLGSLAIAVTIMAAAWLTLTALLPLGRLGWITRTWTELPGAFAAGRGAALNSVLTAAGSATLVMGGSLTTMFRGRSFRAPGIAWLPFLVPGVFLGVLLIAVFNRPFLAGVYQSLGIVVVAFAVRYLAPGWALAAQALRSADSSLADAASSLGATRWQTMRDALLPQVLPGFAAAWYAVYLLCLWDVETVVLIQPPGGETLALRIFNLLHYGHAAQVNALCVVMLGLAVAPLAGWAAVRRFLPPKMANAE